MFKTWLKSHDLNSYNYDGRMLPTISDREFWNNYALEDRDAIVKEAEKYLDFEYPMLRATDFWEFRRSGNRSVMEAKHTVRRQALHFLMLAECIENKGRFIDALTNNVFMTCEESYWGISAHSYRGEPIPDTMEPYIDLMAAEAGTSLAYFRYLFADAYKDILPYLLTRVDYELERRIKAPIMKHKDYFWMGYSGRAVNNWVPWIISNILVVFLLCEDDKAKKVAGIERCLEHIQFFVDVYDPDGGCDEGTTYWGKAGGSLFDCLEELYVATNGEINFFDEPLVKEILRFMRKMYIGGRYFVNYADGSARPGTSPTLLYSYATRIGDEQMRAFAKHMTAYNRGASRTYFRDLAMNYARTPELSAYEGEFCAERDMILPDLEVIAAREAKRGTDGLYISVKGGNNRESHNHNDVGTYVVYFDASPVIVDAGVGIYTRQTFAEGERYKIWTMQSNWHNLPVINGEGEAFGKEHKADRFDYNCTDERVTLTVGVTKAYGEEAKIENFDRNIEFDRSENAKITISDKISFAGEGNSVSESILLCEEPRLEDGKITVYSKAGKALVISYDSSALSATVEERDTSYDAKLSSVWDKSLFRVSLAAKNLGKNAEIKYTISEGK